MNNLKKDKECVKCEYIFDCKGKPDGVIRCLKYKERKGGENGKQGI